jgi:hypothetical protein
MAWTSGVEEGEHAGVRGQGQEVRWQDSEERGVKMRTRVKGGESGCRGESGNEKGKGEGRDRREVWR